MDLPFDGRFQTEVIQHRRAQFGGNLPHRADDLVHDLRHSPSFLPQRAQGRQVPGFGKLFLQPGKVHFQTGQRLAQFVMHLSGDAGAFLFAHRLQIRREQAQLFARIRQLFFRLLQPRDVARDLREADQAALIIPQGGVDDIGLKTGTVLAQPPAFVFGSALDPGLLQILVRHPASDIRLGEKPGQMRAQDFVRAITQQPLRPGVPTGHAPGGVEHENRVVLNTFHQQTEAFLAGLQGSLHAPARAEVAKGQHDAGDTAGIVANGRGALADRRFAPVSRDHKGTIRRAGDDAFQQRLGHEALEFLVRFGVHCLIHLGQRFARGFDGPPAGQFFSHRVHESDPPPGVGDHHGVADALDGGGEPAFDAAEPAVHFVFVEGDLDGGVEALFLDRLEQIAQRFGGFDSLQRRGASPARKINHRHVEALPEDSRGFDAVHRSFEPDVHQHQVRPGRRRQGQGLFSGESDDRNFVAEAPQPFLNILGEEAFVLHHKDACLVHRGAG